MGDYALTIRAESLMTRRAGGASNDIARLRGARFVIASEADQKSQFSESLVKHLTGSDTIVARFLYQENFEFQPTHKLFIATNHRPEIRGTDEAIWRRIHLIPFSVTIPPEEQDKELLHKLKRELPGILAWAVRGCLEWQQDGLNPPEEVRAATQAYRKDMDIIGAFLDDECIQGDAFSVRAKPLYNAYKTWCETNGHHAETNTAFGLSMTERGFEKSEDNRGRRYHKIALLTDREEVEG
jgi:putative DNA primase/helicase